MTKPTAAKRVPLVILLGKVAVIQAAPVTLNRVAIKAKKCHAGQPCFDDCASCWLRKSNLYGTKNFKQREAVTLKRYCLSLLDLIQFSATKA